MTLEITEVDRFPTSGTPSGQGSSGPIEPVEMSLHGARDLVGSLLVPAFLPDGFTLRSVTVFLDRDVSLTYVDGSTTSRAPLLVSLVRKARQKVKAGNVQETSVGEREAHLIHGNWEESSDGVDWNPDTSRTVVFERDGWVVEITGFKDLNAQTLLSVGESLELSHN